MNLFDTQLAKIHQEIQQLEAQFNNPATSSNPEKMKELGIKYSKAKELYEMIKNWEELSRLIAENEALLQQEKDEEIKILIQEEIDKLTREEKSQRIKIKEALIPPNPNDKRNVFLEIRAGAGGDEAALFAADLFRMYAFYSQNKGWQVEIVNQNRNDLGGLKEIISFISGHEVYKNLKNESGVHRVQRIPATEKSGRVHTSTVTVAVLPEVETAEMNINPQDLRVDVFRSSGPGGQSVNTTDSAVRITHLPSGLVVICQDQKSQHKNKEKALKVLSARLLAFEEEKRKKEMGNMRSSQVGTGDRSEKIRTYNFPQSRITDHRLKKSWYNLEGVLQGKLEEIISSFQ